MSTEQVAERKLVTILVIAVFGAPPAHEDHAERALHAALAMQHRRGELFGSELALRIGVNTGEATTSCGTVARALRRARARLARGPDRGARRSLGGRSGREG